jgi:hypothetical protein
MFQRKYSSLFHDYLYSKNIILALRLTKLKHVAQGFFFLTFHKLLNKLKYIFNLEKDEKKKKAFHIGIFLFFHTVCFLCNFL